MSTIPIQEEDLHTGLNIRTDLVVTKVFQDVFDITMTYRHDSEVPLRYGAFVDKTTKKEIKNGFLKYYEKKHTTTNLTTYNISELSKRTKGSNFMYNSMFSGEEGRNCLFWPWGIFST